MPAFGWLLCVKGPIGGRLKPRCDLVSIFCCCSNRHPKSDGSTPPHALLPNAPPLQPLNYRGRQLLADWMATLGLGQGPAHLLIVSFVPFSHPKQWDGSPHMLQPGHASAITSAPLKTLTFGWWLYRAAKQGPPKANAPFPNIFLSLFIPHPKQENHHRRERTRLRTPVTDP